MSHSGRALYGPLAAEFADCFQPDDPVIVLDHLGVAEALRDCASRRFRNETFFVRAVLQRENAARIDAVTPSIIASFSTLDERRAALEQAFAGTLHANGQVLQSIPVYSPAAIRLMQAAIRLSDGLVVYSEAERRRVQDLLKIDPPTVILSPQNTTIPLGSEHRESGVRDAIVVWAPHMAGEAAVAFVVTISDLHTPLLLVSKTRPADTLGSEWVPADRIESALARAKLIVDTNPFGADDAPRLATWDAPLVADVESGTHELLENVRVFDRSRMSSVFDAVVCALGSAPARLRFPADGRPLATRRSQDMMVEGPLVSIVIPTLDRPTLLRYALRSCLLQTYRNVEIIVVVDGGPRLDSLAADFPTVRFLHMPENNPVVSTNTAFAAARGEYITLLSDDDLFFPNHVAALVTALERSGGDVAHSDVLTAFLRGDDSAWQLYGFESNMSEAADLSSFLVTNKIGATAVMARRSCLGSEPFDASIPLYRDYELWLRLLSRRDFVHVERITSCYTTRNQGSGQQSTMWGDQAEAAYRAIYDRYPISNRPLVQQRRLQMLQVAVQGSAGPGMRPAAEVQPASWPLTEQLTEP